MNSIVAETTPLGAHIAPGGCSFGVWSPFAKGVSVEVFEKADASSTPRRTALRREGDEWAGFVEGAKAGDGYRFIIETEQGPLTRLDPRARQLTNSIGIGIIVDPAAFDWSGDEFVLPPHGELIIYEMHVGSFVAGEGSAGHFGTAAERLPHLKTLGINAIQIMPVTEFPGDYNWGYSPAHFYAVESGYGGADGLRSFVKACHAQGIAVILDVVFNHAGPDDQGLWRFDGWSENDRGGIYFYNDERADTPWGPRPDFGRAEVREFIRDNILMWLDEYRIDGFRVDSTLYVRTLDGGHDGHDDNPDGWTLLQWLNDEIAANGRTCITIAEDLRGLESITAPVSEGGAGFHTQWDANFVYPVRAAVITPEDGERSMTQIKEAILHRYNGDAFRRVIYSESHDEVANGKSRVPQEVNDSDPKGWFAQKRSILAAGLVFTAPGIPMIFQGQEFLQGEYFRDDVPLDWDLHEEFSGIVRFYRDLIRLRLNKRGHTRGLLGQFVNVYHHNEEDNVCVFQRWDQHGPGDDVVVIMNFSNNALPEYRIGMPAPGKWLCRMNSDSHHYSDAFGNSGIKDGEAAAEPYDGLEASMTVDLPPYTILVFSQG